MKKPNTTALILLLVFVTLADAVGQGTVFTYEGRLTENGNPANGSYELEFALYNAETNGNQVATPNFLFPVAVSNGLFRVQLDFGSAFNGDPRWLEITVNPHAASPTVLSPRQRLTPVPYAIYSGKAKMLDGPLPAEQLTGSYSNAVIFANANNSFSGNGAGLTGIVASSLGGFGASDFWRLSGNSNTTAGLHFIGTSDKQPLEFKVNGVRGLRLEDNGDSDDPDMNRDGAPNVIGGSQVNFVAPNVVGATISGGGATNYGGSPRSNGILANYATIGGGIVNLILEESDWATIAGGWENVIGVNSFDSVIGGGERNRIEDNIPGATIAGGTGSRIAGGGSYSAIGGGVYNTIEGPNQNVQNSTIAGGWENRIEGESAFSTIAGGYNSIIVNSRNAAIAGGDGNLIAENSYYATIAGGRGNLINGSSNSIIAGGVGSIIVGASNSFAAGRFCFIQHPGCFMWSDGTLSFTTVRENSFNALATGGYELYSGPNIGVRVAPGGNSWSAISDRNLKENLEPVNSRAVLEKVAALPVTTWNLKTQSPGIRHIGPMAQDFQAAFKVGEDDRHISSSDADGVALVAIQGLNEIVKEKEKQITELERRVQKLEKLLITLTQNNGGTQ